MKLINHKKSDWEMKYYKLETDTKRQITQYQEEERVRIIKQDQKNL